MSQEPDKTSGAKKPLKIMEASNLLYSEFETMVIYTFTELRGRIDNLMGNLNKEIVKVKKEIENITKNQP